MAYWQIASGAFGRDYSAIFIKYGIASFWQDNEKCYDDINIGDTVILKSGVTVIKAAGKVINKGNGDKDWLDFDGWHQPYYVNVHWHVPPYNINNINITGLKQGTISRILQTHIISAADTLIAKGRVSTASKEPTVINIDYETILKHLIKTALSPSAADNFTKTLARIRFLAEYYYYHGKNVLEHETRTFLVIPLLLALGWREQQLKIEYKCNNGKIDIGCFSINHNTETNDDSCIAIIETKAFWSGLDFADKQANEYSINFPKCDILIATNGFCYKIFRKTGNKFTITKPSAYLNLLKPSQNYPLDNSVGGALEAISMLLPHRLS